MKSYKLALITGATSGIGEALCTLLASKGIPLIITGRNEQKLQDLSTRLKVPVITCAADLVQPAQRKKVAALIETHIPDLVINNAGAGLYGDVLDFPLQEQMEILEVNANAVLELTIAAAKALKEHQKKGTILNVASAAAFFPFPAFSVYAASKTFVLQFSKSFDVETSPFGIRILCACPGQIDTDFRNRAAKGHPQTKTSIAISKERAALYIWQQIEKEIPCTIFDFRTRLGVALSRLIPDFLIVKILKRNILKRVYRT